MKLGYCTNGLAHHTILGGLELLASTGFQSAALCVDHGWLGPADPNFSQTIEKARDFLTRHNMDTVIEGTAPYILDPLVKHGPSLIEADTARAATRIDFLRHCIDIAAELNSKCVSIKSGFKPAGLSYASALEVFAKHLQTVAMYANEQDVLIAIEPTPGMLIDNTGRFDRLLVLSKIENLKLTLDVGQLFCLSEVPIASFIEHWRDRLINVHLCDVRVGKPEHLVFGEGQIYFPPIFEALMNIGYQHNVHVELDRHSHEATQVVRDAFKKLDPVFVDITQSGSRV
ncbi:MAG: sugar phosphate isomerase/epimerase family protein [Planctomycetota bacterium]